MQNKYNLFYNPNPNRLMMTYFYPQKHGMAAGNSLAEPNPACFPNTGPPLKRSGGPGYETDTSQAP